MITLGADTSTRSLTVALVEENKTLAEYNSRADSMHSSLLIPTVAKALKKSRSKISDIGLFSVGIGPGSFTGLRVGLASIRAMAIALGRPVAGVPTMDAVAYNGLAYLKRKGIIEVCPNICPVIDARKGQVYYCVYSHKKGDMIRKTDYLLGPADALAGRLRASALFLGDGAAVYKDRLSRPGRSRAYFLEGNGWLPRASVIARMGIKRYEDTGGEDPYGLLPLYLYARDCNVKRGRAGRGGVR